MKSKKMANVAQLVRVSVCGTECRRFESGHSPHFSRVARAILKTCFL